MCQVVNCKVGIMKSQKDAGGLFALVTMEKPDDVNFCISKLNQTVFRGNRISVMKVCEFVCCYCLSVLPSVLVHCWFGSMKGFQLVKTSASKALGIMSWQLMYMARVQPTLPAGLWRLWVCGVLTCPTRMLRVRMAGD